MLPPADYLPPTALDQHIFDTLVPQDHYLRRLVAVVDFERCREELASCYSPDQGRPAIEPTLLLKLEFLEYHYNLCDRQVIDQSRYNMAFRYFLGRSLKSALPHHTLLTVFTLHEAGDELTCPAGQTTRQRQRHRHDTGWLFRFPRPLCAACPLQKHCLRELPQHKGRTVSTNDYAAEYRAARVKAQTADYQETRRQHWRIERKLGEMTRWHNARHARYRGQAKSLMPALLTGLVVNAKRLVKLVAGGGGLTEGTVRADLAGGVSLG